MTIPEAMLCERRCLPPQSAAPRTGCAMVRPVSSAPLPRCRFSSQRYATLCRARTLEGMGLAAAGRHRRITPAITFDSSMTWSGLIQRYVGGGSARRGLRLDRSCQSGLGLRRAPRTPAPRNIEVGSHTELSQGSFAALDRQHSNRRRLPRPTWSSRPCGVEIGEYTLVAMHSCIVPSTTPSAFGTDTALSPTISVPSGLAASLARRRRDRLRWRHNRRRIISAPAPS